MEVMRFYGWTWFELMDCPITAFWVCYRQMGRIKAQESLQQLELIAQPNVSDETRQKFMDRQVEIMGSVVTSKQAPNMERDPDAISKLRALAG